VISLRERAGALSERPFRLLWLGQTTSAIGDVMIGVALAFAVFEIGGGAAQLGLVLASLTIGRMAFVLVGGVVALRIRPERPLVGAFAAWSLSALPALALLPPLPTASVAAAYSVFQAGIAFGNNQFDTVLQREIPSHLLSRVDSFVWLVALGLTPVGQALAGPASEAFGTDAVLITAAALVVVSCALGIAAPSVRAITSATPAPASSSGSAAESLL
jgi:MFS family permease